MTLKSDSKLTLLATSLLAVFVLAFTIWASVRVLQRPDAGATWSFVTGRVQAIEPNGPAVGILHQGDLILTINGQSVWNARGYPNHQPGDLLQLQIRRGNQTFTSAIQLSAAQTLLVISRLTPLFLGFAFWIIGILAAIFDRSSARWWVFCYGLAVCLSLATGAISSFGPLWIVWLFGFLLWWDGPLIVHVHLRIFRPSLARSTIWLSSLLWGLSALLALVGSLAHLGMVAFDGQLIQTVEYGWLGINVILAVGTTIGELPRLAARRIPYTRAAILGLLTTLSLLPTIMLGLLPDALFGQPILPYELSFLALILIPVGYGITLFEDRFVNLVKSMGHTLSIVITIIILATIYLGIYYGFLIIAQTWNRILLLSGLAFIMAIIFTGRPIYRFITNFVDLLVFGEMYDFQTAIEEIERSLRDAENTPKSVAERLCRSLRQVLPVEFAGLILRDGFMIASTKQEVNPLVIQVVDGAAVCEFLDDLQNISSREEIRQRFYKMLTYSAVDNQRLMHFISQAEILLPLHGSQGSPGLLFLGKRMGLHGYESRDLRLLGSIVEQGSIAIENAFLLDEVQEHIAQTIKLHHQILQTREDERKRVARDLHDQVIQSLVGLKYKISELQRLVPMEKEGNYIEVQEDIRELCNEVRRICAELRPPSLDTVGLIPAIESRIAELNQQEYYQIFFQTHVDEEWEISETTAVCLFRVFQEAMSNIKKHSAATQVKVAIEVGSNEVSLSVEDNGQGFSIPSHMDEFVRNFHFGLVGIREMLEAIGGHLSIESLPGSGCRIIAIVPQEETESILRERVIQ